MYSKWFDEYHKKDANIQINYQSIGSGGGIGKSPKASVDFGASDGPMNDARLKAYQDKHGYGILHFPTVLGADVPTYNIPGVTAELNLRLRLSGIFLGKITKWNDPHRRTQQRRKTTGGRHYCNSPRGKQRYHHIWTDYLSRSATVEEQSWAGNRRQLAGWFRRPRQRGCIGANQADTKFVRLC
jgi:phosphate transport system substrate-binding protein